MSDRIIPGRQAELERNIAKWQKRLRQVTTDSEKRYYRKKIQEARDEIARIEGRTPDSDKKRAAELMEQAESTRRMAAGEPVDRRRALLARADELEREAAKLDPSLSSRTGSGSSGGWGKTVFGNERTTAPGGMAAPMIDPIKLQEGLAALGYYKGPIDGIIGPMTNKAIKEWEAAGSPAFPAAGTSAPAPAASTAPSIPSLPVTSGGGGGGMASSAAPAAAESPTKNMSDQEIDQFIRDNYGMHAWALDIPELAVTLRQAIREDWPPGKLESRLQQTDWWRTTAPSVRAFLEANNRDPEGMEVRISQAVDGIYRYMGQVGLDWVTPERAWAIAVDSIKFGWSTDKLQQVLHGEFRWHANVGSTPDRGDLLANRLKQIADLFLVPLAPETIDQWVNDVLAGRVDEQGFELEMREQAKSLFPSLTVAIDRGQTVRQFIAPYAQIAARELEINPDDIDWMDPKWMRAVSQIDPKTGERVALSLADWASEIRSNSEYGWQNTTAAKETTMELARTIGERWGLV